jgi:hypothetical protein
MVGFTRRAMSDRRGTMSNGHDRIPGLVETMGNRTSLHRTSFGAVSRKPMADVPLTADGARVWVVRLDEKATN